MHPPAPRLLDRLGHAIRVRHYSPRTEETYRHWVRRFIRFHGKRHPSALGAPEIAAFLNHLAVEEHVSASTQNQALSAIVFLYRKVLDQEPPQLEGLIRARKPRRLPVVLTAPEVQAILAGLEGLTLRVKDVDFGRLEIRVRDGKERKDRVPPLPAALARKYPSAGREWGWQYVFPATSRFEDCPARTERRHHFHESAVQRAVTSAVRACGIAKPAIYTHVLNRGGRGVRSPSIPSPPEARPPRA